MLLLFRAISKNSMLEIVFFKIIEHLHALLLQLFVIVKDANALIFEENRDAEYFEVSLPSEFQV